MQDSDVAFFLDGDDLGRVPDGALGQLVLERLQQEVPLHATDFVRSAEVTKKMTRGVQMFARQIIHRQIGVEHGFRVFSSTFSPASLGLLLQQPHQSQLRR